MISMPPLIFSWEMNERGEHAVGGGKGTCGMCKIRIQTSYQVFYYCINLLMQSLSIKSAMYQRAILNA